MPFYLRPSLITFTSADYNSGTPLILSDMSRQPVQMDVERIENRERMASGRMRSKFIADKLSLDLEWEFLPSRTTVSGTNVVSDGYASSTDLKRFYDAVKGEFNCKIYADPGTGGAITVGALYKDIQVFFDSFSIEIVKRGANFDIHRVSMGLEEA